MKKFLPLVLCMFFMINAVSAATIHGTVYDLELNKVNDVVIEVDSVPKQRIVSDNGEYSFNLPKGDYTITALAYTKGEENIASEEITINQDGEYVLDLFLFPNLDYIDNLDFDIGADLNEPVKSKLWVYVLVIALVMVLLLILRLKKRLIKAKQEEKEESEESDEGLDEVYDILKKEKRITQKELRKRINLSESKISLIISQLESEGKIKKIKKGRTNIIIIN